MEWALLPLKRYAEFSGRSRRLEFWSFAALNMVAAAIVLSVFFTIGDMMGSVGPQQNPFVFFSIFGFFGLFLLVWWLFMLVPTAAVTVRRLHDRDMSGWWYVGYLVVIFVPLINLIAVIAMLVIMLMDGTPGPNRYGPDPKGRGVVDVFS